MTAAAEQSGSFASSTGQSFTEANWLDTHFLAMQPEYEAMVRSAGIQRGWRVLDAGAGSGGFLPLLAELVGPQGSIDAVDAAAENVHMIEARAAQSQWPAPVTARVGSVTALPYPDNTFDAVWCANVSQYLSDEDMRAALDEFRRVVRPGGLVAVKEYDITAQQMQPAPPMLYLHWHEANLRSGDVNAVGMFRAIRLSEWLRAAGLEQVRQQPTLMVRFQPLKPAERTLVTSYHRACAAKALGFDLPEDEQRIWQVLADTDNPNHIVYHPDFQYRGIQTLFTGCKPRG